MTKVILVRHGQSDANVIKMFAGVYDSPLTALGHAQAECVAKAIREQYHVDAVYASDLQRANVTGQRIAEACGLPLQVDIGLRECYMGEWEGLTFADAEKNFHELFWEWRTDIGNSRCPGGEKPGDAGDRMYDTVRRIVDRHPGETVAIATHSVVIRALECRITKNRDYNEMKNVPYVQNASITVMEWDGDDVRYTLIGDERHLGELRSMKFP